MNGGIDEISQPTNADLRPCHPAQYALPDALLDLVQQRSLGGAAMNILEELDHALDQTPEHVYMCRPLTRRTVAAAAAEIRRLHAVLAVGSSPGKTRPAAVLLAALDAPALTASAGDGTDGGQL